MGRRLSEEGVSDLTILVPDDIFDKSGTMESRARRNRLRSVVGICLFLALTGIVYLGYFCPDHVCALTNRQDVKDQPRIPEGLSIGAPAAALSSVSIEIDKNGLFSVHPAFKLQSIQGSLGYDDVFANDTFQFDINARDVMVFLHIQKTGMHNVRTLITPFCSLSCVNLQTYCRLFYTSHSYSQCFIEIDHLVVASIIGSTLSDMF